MSLSDAKPDVLTLPLFAETATIDRRLVTERVTVRRETRTREVTIEEALERSAVVVERVPIGEYVEAIPAVRDEGDMIVFPVVAEVAVVVRRLLLREEVRVRKVRTTTNHVETITLREQHAVVSRIADPGSLDPQAATPAPPVTGGAISTPSPATTRSVAMPEETIVAVYDSAAHADSAIADLRAANVPEHSISRHVGTHAIGGAPAQPVRQQGFWSSLFGGTSSDEPVYDRSLDTGSSVVVVKAPEQDADAVILILDRHSPIDIDERATGYGLATSDLAVSGATASVATQPATGVYDATTPTTGAVAGETSPLSLSEESLTVGKRLVNRGGTRIRRYVVETPVEESVTLHSENVKVERHAVAGGTAISPDFSEKTIEMTATAEEAVVGKTARVVEEVVLRKEANDRTETVRDTVRRQEVEVEQVPAGTTAGSALDPRSPKI